MFDAVIALSGCDKTIPGTVMALCRLDIPSLMLYGGSILPGYLHGERVTIQEVFEAVGAHAAGRITDEELTEIEDVASPGAGACGGQFTANTMAMAFEVLGISPAGFGMVPAVDRDKATVAERAGALVMDILKRDLRPSDIITRDSLENAIAAIACSGGSTNGVLHLLAIASEMGIELDIDDFDEISERTPLICDLKPGGQYVAPDLYEAGGVPLVMQAPAGRRPAARGRDDRHRPDDRRDRRWRHRDAGPEGGPPAERSDQGDRRPGHPARQPRPRRLRGQARRLRAAPADRSGPRVRVRGGGDGRRHATSRSTPATSS